MVNLICQFDLIDVFHWAGNSGCTRHTDKSRSSRYRDIGNLAVAIAIYIGKMTAITAISRIQKNIFKKCILVFLAVFSCLKQAPKLLRATLSLHEHL